MTGTDVARFTHKQFRSYLNHLVYIINNILTKSKDDKRDVARKEEKYIRSFGKKKSEGNSPPGRPRRK